MQQIDWQIYAGRLLFIIVHDDRQVVQHIRQGQGVPMLLSDRKTYLVVLLGVLKVLLHLGRLGIPLSKGETGGRILQPFTVSCGDQLEVFNEETLSGYIHLLLGGYEDETAQDAFVSAHLLLPSVEDGNLTLRLHLGVRRTRVDGRHPQPEDCILHLLVLLEAGEDLYKEEVVQEVLHLLEKLGGLDAKGLVNLFDQQGVDFVGDPLRGDGHSPAGD